MPAPSHMEMETGHTLYIYNAKQMHINIVSTVWL